MVRRIVDLKQFVLERLADRASAAAQEPPHELDSEFLHLVSAAFDGGKGGFCPRQTLKLESLVLFESI